MEVACLIEFLFIGWMDRQDIIDVIKNMLITFETYIAMNNSTLYR